jgi:hypothetical protein
LFGRAGVARLIERGPRAAVDLLELAYLSVYLVLPAGFAVARVIDPALDAGRYWTPVVLAELSCYAFLPWIQTRPPRAAPEHAIVEPALSAIRRVNALVLSRGSIQVNTFPSGHAAGAVATALAVGGVSTGAGVVFGVIALGIVVGSVTGRYHYAADSIAGVVVALIAWTIARAF